MRKIFLALISSVLLTGTALAEEVKIGIILGFTGPIESLTPDMGAGAELAIAEVNGVIKRFNIEKEIGKK